MAVYTFNGNYTYIGTIQPDQFYLNNATHYVSAYGDDGGDYIISGIYNDYLYGGGGSDFVYAGSGSDTVDGGSGNDILSGNIDNQQGVIVDDFYSDYVYGGSGDDVIYAFSYDSAYGGADNDFYSVIAASYSVPLISENASSGVDTVAVTGYSYAPIDTYIVPDNVENTLIFANVINVVGNGIDNLIVGNDLDNILSGGEGNDSLSGSIGADYLYGGNGSDYLTGGVGNDFLFGDGGRDTLFGDAGADAMSGGGGDDLYVVENLADTVIESAGGGYDEVYSSVNFTLPNDVETLFLAGSAIYATGNSGSNAIIGNDTDNIIDAGAGETDFINGAGGNDLIVGGAGHDEMMGGAGSDIFRFANTSDGVYDFIYDFTPGQDRLQFNAAAFGITSILDGTNFAAGPAPTVKGFGPSILYNDVYGYLFFDADGAGNQAPTVIGLLNGLPHLTYNDIILY